MAESDERGPVRVEDQHARHNRVARFNAALAVGITRIVSSMWCAYGFGGLALVSLPNAIHTGTATLISWIAQTFLQLVLLSIIMVGQDVQAKASDARGEQTFNDAEEMKATLQEVHQLVRSLPRGPEGGVKIRG